MCKNIKCIACSSSALRERALSVSLRIAIVSSQQKTLVNYKTDLGSITLSVQVADTTAAAKKLSLLNSRIDKPP